MALQSASAVTTLAPANPWALVPPLGNLDAYISAVNRLPLLTLEEEQRFARQLKDDNDVEAAGRLVMSHLRLVVSISRQYLGYVDEVRSRNLELAAEYLLMAAMLIEIKSRMLLPPKRQEGAAEPEDPRAELVRRLLEYEQMKQAAMRLNQVPQYGRDFIRAQVYIEQSLQPRFPDVDLAELQQAWRDIMRRARLVQHHRITREELSVREYMSQVLKTLQGRRFVPFEDLFQPEKGGTVLVVTFIALLELAKETLIEITQAEAFAPIYVRLAYTPV